MSYTAGDVVNISAPLLNDSIKSLYTFDVQLPYLKIAQQELEQELILNEIPISLMNEAVIPVSIGATELVLPASFFIPISLSERSVGDTNFVPMTERSFVDSDNLIPGQALNYWDFRHNCINFIGATTVREIKLNYWRTIPIIISELSAELVNGAQNLLAFRTAALCAEFIGENKPRADSLNLQYLDARERLIAIFIKNNQGKRVRRKPFLRPFYRRTG